MVKVEKGSRLIMEKPTSQQPDPKESDKQSSNEPEKSQSNEEELDEELDSLLDCKSLILGSIFTFYYYLL